MPFNKLLLRGAVTRKLHAPRGKDLGELGVGSCINRNSTHDFQVPLNTKFCSICMPPFGRNFNVKLYCTSTRLPVRGRVGWTQGVENGTNQNVDPTFLCDFCTQYRLILHRLAIIHNAADRVIRMGCLCYSVHLLLPAHTERKVDTLISIKDATNMVFWPILNWMSYCTLSIDHVSKSSIRATNSCVN